jgi:uncharacterized membrane protein YhhN
MNLSPVFWALVALGVAAAAAYGFYFLNRPAGWLRAGVKTLAIGAPAVGFIFAGAPFPLVLALVASTLGDFFLAFDKKWLLPLGIGSFLIAQLTYFVIFAAIWFFSGDNAPLWPRYLAMGLMIATAGAFLIWTAPKLGWMAFGVVPYAIAITGMAAMSMWLPWDGWPAMLGAALFVISDFVLATELFRLPQDAPVRRITGPVVWWTYVAAQALIVTGILLAAM